MPIWLNYSQVHYKKWVSLLPNYIYFLDNFDDVHKSDKEHILRHVYDGKLLAKLSDPINDISFDNPLIRKILLWAYPYEVLMKFAWEQIQNNDQTNIELIWYFNQFFEVDFEKELELYCKECNRELLQQTYLAHEKWTYEDISQATTLFFDFVETLLVDQWYKDEATGLKEYMSTNLLLKHTPWISWNTDPSNGKIQIDVGNKTYTTLFHELVHAVNRYFRDDYSWDLQNSCNDSMTKTNEWLANFVAYHLMDAIIAGDLDMIDTMTSDPIFFSMYIDIYATVREFGSNDRHHNYDIIYQQLKKFEWDLLTDEKAKFYYERFYKFFHYDQHTYFYPKEMMYYLGYHKMVELFDTSTNKKQLLVNCLLGKICL